MTIEELKQDFESARVKHVYFKSKQRSFLFGNGVEEQFLRNPEQCTLGIWIAERLRSNGTCAHLPIARKFDCKHILIHQEAARLVDMRTAGQTEAANAGCTLL